MKIYYSNDKEQLVYIGSPATPAYWDNQWNRDLKSLNKIYKNNTYVSKISKKYLPKNSTILEGGCGRANHVHALSQMVISQSG